MLVSHLTSQSETLDLTGNSTSLSAKGSARREKLRREFKLLPSGHAGCSWELQPTQEKHKATPRRGGRDDCSTRGHDCRAGRDSGGREQPQDEGRHKQPSKPAPVSGPPPKPGSLGISEDCLFVPPCQPKTLHACRKRSMSCRVISRDHTGRAVHCCQDRDLPRGTPQHTA